jgi:hypothetical protein
VDCTRGVCAYLCSCSFLIPLAALAGCRKSRSSHPPNPGAPRRAFSHASFSHRSDSQRTREGTPQALTRCGLAGSLFEHPAGGPYPVVWINPEIFLSDCALGSTMWQ